MADQLPDIEGANEFTHEARPRLIVNPDGSPADFRGLGGGVDQEKWSAFLESRDFIVATGFQTIAEGETLHLVLRNPIGSGKDLILYRRLFQDSLTDAIEPFAYVAHPGATASFANEPTIFSTYDNGVVSVAEFSFQVSAPQPMGGPIATGNRIPLDYAFPFRRKPGEALGLTISRPATGTQATARAGVNLHFFEVPAS